MFRQGKNDKHREFREYLSAYMDNRLDSARRARLEQHLAQCQACRAELESLRQTVSLLRQMPAVQPPRLFTIRQPEPVRRPALGLALRVATSVAAVLLAAVFALDMSHVFQSAPASTPPVSATAPASQEKSGTMAAAPDTGPAATPSPMPQPTGTAPVAPSFAGPTGSAEAAGPAGPAGPEGAAGATGPVATPQPQTSVSKGPSIAGLATTAPSPVPVSEPTPTPVPTPAPSATPVLRAAAPSLAAQDSGDTGIRQPAGTQTSGFGATEATPKATSRVPFRALEWTLLAIVVGLGAALIITNRTRSRETRGGRK